MNLAVLGLILTSVSLSALAQITLKHGVTIGGGLAAAGQGAGVLGTLLAMLGNGYVMLGLAMYATSAVVWLLVLARLDVSVAYPFVGLGFVLTMLFGYLFFGEQVGLARIAGTVLVVAGVVLISRT